jgi:hypothetical protein
MAEDQNIRKLITDLVAQERELREQLGRREGSAGDERAQLSAIEAELDQCWDLLRRRDAAREFGGNPEQEKARPVDQVEKYLG